VSACVFWALLAVSVTVSVGLLGDTWRGAKYHLSQLGPGEPMDRDFRRMLLRTLATQLVVVSVLFLSVAVVHGWITDRISAYAASVHRDLEARAMAPPSVFGWWGPSAVGAALLFNALLWRMGTINRIRFALRLYGSARFFLKMAIMGFLRAFAPAKDFFTFVPVFRSLPTLALAAFMWADAPDKLAGTISVSCLGLIALVYTLTDVNPPTWLFLSASDFRSFQVFRILRIGWFPRGGITLLDRFGSAHLAAYTAERQVMERLGGVVGAMATLYTRPRYPRVWSIRARDSAWEPVLLTLLRMVPLVVVDVRGESRQVVRELRTILHYGWVQKTVLIGETAGDAAQLHEILRAEGGERFGERIVTEDMLRAAVWVGHRLVLPHFEISIRP